MWAMVMNSSMEQGRYVMVSKISLKKRFMYPYEELADTRRQPYVRCWKRKKRPMRRFRWWECI